MKMENTRISFEVPSTGAYTVEELTAKARHFIMELVLPAKGKTSDDEIARLIQNVFPPRTVEEKKEELDRRIQQMEEEPSSMLSSDEFFKELEAL
jgi:polyhydroxyalkanoate synthesis regulator phasin